MPCERTMKAEMHKFKKDPGINEEDIRQSAEMYASHKARKVQNNDPLPLGEGVLMWDETKVI